LTVQFGIRVRLLGDILKGTIIMRKTILATSSALSLMVIASPALAQSQQVMISNGTNANCYGATGNGSCTPPNSTPKVATTVSDGSTSSAANVQASATALESYNSAYGYAAVGTQITSSARGSGTTSQIVGYARDTSGNVSGILAEGSFFHAGSSDSTNRSTILELESTRALFGYAPAGTNVTNGLEITSTLNTLIGNSAATGTFTVSGASTLHGIDNSNSGITNAGLVSGVTAGAVNSSSTEAINGSQLDATNQNVAAAQSAANTAVTNAAAAQTTANTALANAATAQTSADNAQSTANTALANAATAQTAADNAQSTADTALANAATAQATADGAQSTANTALSGVATAQAAATAAQTSATAAQTSATAAQNDAAIAVVAAQNAVKYDQPGHTSVTLNSGGSAVAIHNVAAGVSPTDAVNMSQLNAVNASVTSLGTRVTTLESRIGNFSQDIRRIDRLAGRGTAIALSAASIPQMADGQNIAVGVGFGTYDGRTAFSAAILGRISDNAQFRLNAGTTGAGKVGAGGGITFGW
jgi:hypothetical protein